MIQWIEQAPDVAGESIDFAAALEEAVELVNAGKLCQYDFFMQNTFHQQAIKHVDKGLSTWLKYKGPVCVVSWIWTGHVESGQMHY